MKKITSHYFSAVILIMALFIISTTNAQVGINTVTPVEMLDVNGNLKLDGAFMPGNAFGGVDQILLSQGTGTPPVWGPGFINTSEMDFIGKWYVTPTTITGGGVYTVVTVTDPEMTTSTVVSWNFVGAFPACNGTCNIQYGNNFRAFVETRTGQVLFHFWNSSNRTLVNAQIQYVAYYNQ